MKRWRERLRGENMEGGREGEKEGEGQTEMFAKIFKT